MISKHKYLTPEIEITRFVQDEIVMNDLDNSDNENFGGDHIYQDGPSVPETTVPELPGGWF